MSRSRKPIAPFIRNLTPSQFEPGKFDIAWSGKLYILPYELIKPLADYFATTKENEVSVEKWYRSLPEEQAQQISWTAL